MNRPETYIQRISEPLDAFVVTPGLNRDERLKLCGEDPEQNHTSLLLDGVIERPDATVIPLTHVDPKTVRNLASILVLNMMDVRPSHRITSSGSMASSAHFPIRY